MEPPRNTIRDEALTGACLGKFNSGSAKPAELDVPQRQLPFRFVWQTDAQTHLTLASQDVVDLLGSKTAAVLCRSWIEIAQSLNLDPQGQIAKRAHGARDV